MTTRTFPDDAVRVAPRVGTVGAWGRDAGGQPLVVIDGVKYGADLATRALHRGAVVRYVGAPGARGLPHVDVVEVLDPGPMVDVPAVRVVRVGRRQYTVTREPATGLRYIYRAFEPASVDKVALRRRRVASRTHALVATVDASGAVRRALHDADPARPSDLAVYAPAAFLGLVTSRRGGSPAALRAEAEAAIRAAYGDVWRELETADGDVVASD